MNAIKAADGAGSGLDADLLDGSDSTTFGGAAQQATNTTDIAALQAMVISLQTQVVALQNLSQHLTRAGDDLYLTGANLHIISGSGATDGAVSGLGNLIICYNESRSPDPDVRTGSHNLVVGLQHNYSSYGGVVFGSYNTVSGPSASVSGGDHITASGDAASVSGGNGNTASGNDAAVSVGNSNNATGPYASVSGVIQNTATGSTTSVSGGHANIASGLRASVSGGAPIPPAIPTLR